MEPEIHWQGVGDAVDLAPVEALAHEVSEYLAGLPTDLRDRDRVEGHFCTPLGLALSDVPVSTLDDAGFWRYLGLGPFWGFVSWREEGSFRRGNFLRYLDATTPTESVLNRMFLRSRALGPEGASLAGSLAFSTDFWRSHILRVRTSNSPALTRAFVRSQQTERLSTDALRAMARSLNRLASNVLMNDYADDEAEALIREVRVANQRNPDLQ